MHPIIAAMRTRLNLSGTLSTGGVTATITSATRTIRGSGTLLFDTLVEPGTTNAQYSLNGGTFTDITNGLTLSVGAGQTLAVRATGMAVSDVVSFNLKRNTGGSLIEAVAIERTS